MYKESQIPKVCAISGDPIKNIGSLNELQRRKDVDGVHTDIGTISRRMYPVYQRAVGEVASVDPLITPKDLRRAVNAKVNDADYVREALQEDIRDQVFSLLAGDITTGDRDSEKIVLKLRNLFIQDVDVRSYISKEKEDGFNGLPLKKALGCMRDDIRTIKFCDSLLRAVEEQESKKEVVEVVDAGSGPLPIFGILAALKSDKVRATCLELNPHSAAMAEKIIKNLALEGRVRVVCGDAREYKHDCEVDVLISETMFAGLTNGEQMVQILEHLASQVGKSGEVIPKSITVEAGIAEFGRGYVTELNIPLREVYKYEGGDKWAAVEFEIDIDDLEPNKPYELVLASKVDLGDGTVLQGYDSHITRPTRAGAMAFVLSEDGLDNTLGVSYNPGAENGEIIMETFEK